MGFDLGTFLGGLVGAAGGLISGISDNDAAQKINSQNIAMQRETNELNRYLANRANMTQIQMMRENNEFNAEQQLKQWLRETHYNDPSMQVSRMLAAGLNPAAVAGNSQSSGNVGMSAPQATGSGISPIVPHLDAPRAQMYVQPGAVTLAAFNSLADTISKISHADLTRAQKKSIIDKLEPEISKIESETERNKLLNEFQSIQNDLESIYGYAERNARAQKAYKDLELLTEQVFNAKLSGKKINEETISEKTNRLLTLMRAYLTGEQWRLAKEELAAFPVKLKSLLSVQAAQANELNASAGEHQARTITENQLRNYKRQAAYFSAQLLAAENYTKHETMGLQVEMFIENLKNAGLMNDKLYQDALRALKDNDWYETDKILKSVPNINFNESHQHNSRSYYYNE